MHKNMGKHETCTNAWYCTVSSSSYAYVKPLTLRSGSLTKKGVSFYDDHLPD